MKNERIAQALGQLFDKQRIVFWYDTQQEFAAEFAALDLPDVEKIEPGDEIDVDVNKGEIKILNKNITIKTKPLPEFIQHIADCGGLINYIKD